MVSTGFPVRVVSHPSLRSHDTRRTPPPHLSRSLICLRDILIYLKRIDVRFYRLASAFLPIPPGTPPDTLFTTALRQINECAAECALLASQVNQQHVRLTMHLDHHIALGSNDTDRVAHSLATIEAQTALLDHLGARAEGVLVVHVGGERGQASLERFARHYERLSAAARTRLVVEHDLIFSLGQLLWLHQRCGIPIVFDYLHWRLFNPEHLPAELAPGLALATWPDGVRPKMHLSTPRTEAHVLPARGTQPARVLPPHHGQHADFVAAADLLALLQATRGLPPFDLMLEAKAGDMAVLRARADVARLAPHLTPSLA